LYLQRSALVFWCRAGRLCFVLERATRPVKCNVSDCSIAAVSEEAYRKSSASKLNAIGQLPNAPAAVKFETGLTVCSPGRLRACAAVTGGQTTTVKVNSKTRPRPGLPPTLHVKDRPPRRLSVLLPLLIPFSRRLQLCQLGLVHEVAARRRLGRGEERPQRQLPAAAEEGH
jgi:hypothetical protein